MENFETVSDLIIRLYQLPGDMLIRVQGDIRITSVDIEYISANKDYVKDVPAAIINLR